MTQAIVVKTYKASKQSKAAEAFAKDANWAGNEGYVPVAQSWSPPQSSAAALMAGAGVCALVGLFFLSPVLIVALLLLIAAVATPEHPGELTVTYSRT